MYRISVTLSTSLLERKSFMADRIKQVGSVLIRSPWSEGAVDFDRDSKLLIDRDSTLFLIRIASSTHIPLHILCSRMKKWYD